MAIDYKHFLPCWYNLCKEQQKLLSDNIVVKTYNTNEIVSINRAKKDGLVLVLDGNLRLFIASDTGREITLLNIKSGEVFCIMTADRARPMDVVPCLQATEKTVMAYIPRDILQPIALEVPELAIFLFNAATDIAQSMINSNAFYFFNTLRGCIANFIIEKSMPGKDEVKTTHEEIANSLATTRVVVSRELEMLSDMGFIETRRGRIKIIDREGLIAFSQQN